MRFFAPLSCCLLAACAVETSDVESAENVWQWTDDVQIPDMASPNQVAAVSWVGDVLMAATQSDGTIRIATYYQDWRPLWHVQQYADGGPALALRLGIPYLIYHRAGQNRLMSSSLYNGVWSAPITAGSSIGTATILGAPAATAWNNQIYVAYCKRTSAGDRVQIDRFDGISWYGVKTLDRTGTRCGGVALGVLPNGELEELDTENDNLYESRLSGTTWITRTLPMKSKTPPSLVTCGTTTHLVHGGYAHPDEIWWTYLDGTVWQGDVVVPNQASAGGAALACQGTQAMMIHDGGYPQLWWSRYGV